MDSCRGRYRTSLAKAAPITANAALPYRFALPTTNHAFLPGHRIMVQVQSSWFPLYDRNPQIFVPNIMFAAPDSYRKATQRITVAGPDESFIRSEEHTSELQSLMRISYAVFCLKKKKKKHQEPDTTQETHQ